MISLMAVEDIEELEAKYNIKLNPADVIRLNALGCRAERHPDAYSFYDMPRCAFLGDVVFREPTIGHEIWMSNMLVGFDENDLETIFFLRAYALSREEKDLPNIAPNKVQKIVSKFIEKELKQYTPRQIVSVINYVMLGCDPNSDEQPYLEEDEDKNKDLNFTTKSIAVGVMHESQALKLGITIDDMKRMTISELQNVILRAKELKGVEVQEEIRKIAIGDYYKTKNEIIKKYMDKENG